MRKDKHGLWTKGRWVDAVYYDVLHTPIIYNFRVGWVSIISLVEVLSLGGLLWVALTFFSDLDNEVFVYLISFGVILLFGLFGNSRIVYAMIKKKPGIKLNHEGLYHFDADITFKWEDIREAKLVSGEGHEGIGIKLHNPKYYESLIGNPLSRLIRKLRFRPSEADFLLGVSFLEGDEESILKQINVYRFAVNSHRRNRWLE